MPDSSSLVALRDRREAAIQQLADSFAADLLTMDQFDERVARAHGATTVAELDALVADLPPPAGAKSTALVPLTVEPACRSRPSASAPGSAASSGTVPGWCPPS